MVNESKLLGIESFDWDYEQPLSEEESYRALLHSLDRKQGFNLLFVRCSPIQGDKIIDKLRQDLLDKKVAILELDSEADNLYDQILEIPNYDDLNVLFIRGLETALLRYEEAESQGYDRTSQSPFYGGTWAGVPRILGHLNLSRERFDEQFSFALVFLLPEFALRYFIRRAPDFFDWRSGLYEFPTDLITLDKEAYRLAYIESSLDSYQRFSLQQRQAKLAEIKSYLSESYDLDTNRIFDLWFVKGLVHAIGQEYEEAIVAYDHAIEIKSDNHQAWYNRGNSFLDLGRLEEAITSYDHALEIKPDYPKALNNRENALSKNRKAITSHYTDYCFREIEPSYRLTYNNWDIDLTNLGIDKDVIKCFDDAREIKFDDYLAWYIRGILLACLGRYEEAIASYNCAIAINPDKHEAWNNRGMTLKNLEQYDKAIVSFNRALQLQLADHKELGEVGITSTNLDKYKQATNSHQKVFSINPNFIESYYNLSCIYSLQQNITLALDNLQQAIALNSQFREMAKTESDFDLIRDNPQFQSLLK